MTKLSQKIHETENANTQKAAEESRRKRAEIREDRMPPATEEIVSGTDFPDDLVYGLYLPCVLSVNSLCTQASMCELLFSIIK